MFRKTARNAIYFPQVMLESQSAALAGTPTKKSAQVLNIGLDSDVSSSPRANSVPLPSPGPTSVTRKRKSVFTPLQSPLTFLRSVASSVSSQESSAESAQSRTAKAQNAAEVKRLRRRQAPAALAILDIRPSESSPLSPFRHGLMRTPVTPLSGPAWSPLPAITCTTPLRSVSSLARSRAKSVSVQQTDELEKLTRCLEASVPQDVLYSSLGSDVEKITCFLDLYRMGYNDKTSQRPASAHPERLSRIGWETEGAGRGRRMSRDPTAQNRRSRSVGDFYVSTIIPDIDCEPVTPGLESMKRLSKRLSAALRLVQSPVTPYRSSRRYSTTLSADANVQRTRTLLRAKQTILGTDAELMETFRARFGTRPLDFQGAPFPAPTGPLPSPPATPASTLAKAKSPKAPYWVRSSLTPQSYERSFEFLRDDTKIAEKTEGSIAAKPRAPATPRTRRIERRQGWGGEWHRGSLAEVVDQLKDL
ncbi:hypothetical protein CERSUDRAFT_68693 [Gelatoporia subvermispora B]|uniref:Uncharacterized protein n=1 Tax=Ceriporiopsis subvermispora (strain B) TaxID=914234 RepID=M2Q682_CERS8|nr:hypothetical protein CERSUDRAFT_68693 [Gelatoporia subvermispora B]